MLKTYTVIHIIEAEGFQWQFFRCEAEDSDHAQEQCENAYPDCFVLWVNEGDDRSIT